jgi:hypothetical protein
MTDLTIGFTGTQIGLTSIQIETLRDLLTKLICKEEYTIVFGLHGDCYGGDETFHKIAYNLGCRIVIHPPLNDSKRAFCEGDKILEPKEYLERNRDIVDACDILIACPKERTEQLRSGTWATVRYGLKKKKPTYIICPDGELVQKV